MSQSKADYINVIGAGLEMCIRDRKKVLKKSKLRMSLLVLIVTSVVTQWLSNLVATVSSTHVVISQTVITPRPLPVSYTHLDVYKRQVFERLSAGTGYTYFGDGNYDEVFYDEELDHDFASWVFGDSMEPTYLNGEVVLIKQTGLSLIHI